MDNCIAIINLIAVLIGNFNIIKNPKLSIIMFMVCNVCYWYIIWGNMIAVSTNVILFCIGIYNLYIIRGEKNKKTCDKL